MMSMNPLKKISEKLAHLPESKRVIALDLTRFLAMVMMIQGHTIAALVSPEHFDSSVFPFNFWHFLRGFTAPVFLLVSGASNVFANKRLEDGTIPRATNKKRIRMAVIIVLIGYLYLFPANRLFDLPFIEPQYWIPFFQVNILQLIGVSLLMLLLVFNLTKNDRQLRKVSLIIAISITLLSPLVHQVNWFNYLLEPFGAYLSFEHGSIFSIFPYTAFLFYGVVLGTYLKGKTASERNTILVKYCAIAGVGFLVLQYPLEWIYELIPFGINSVAKVNAGFVSMQLGCVLLGVSALTILYAFTTKLSKLYILFGQRALYIYIIHLIFIYGTPWFPSIGKIYAKEFTLTESIIAAVIVEVLTLGSIYLYEKSVTIYPRSRKAYKISIGLVFAFLMLLGSPLMF
jgi:uncharacterized membrane protein